MQMLSNGKKIATVVFATVIVMVAFKVGGEDVRHMISLGLAGVGLGAVGAIGKELFPNQPPPQDPPK